MDRPLSAELAESQKMRCNQTFSQYYMSLIWLYTFLELVNCDSKMDGHLCICLSPKDLNNVINWCQNQTYIIDKIRHKLIGGKHLSKLNEKLGYWSICLDEESQPLTTFNTVFSRFCYTHQMVPSCPRTKFNTGWTNSQELTRHHEHFRQCHSVQCNIGRTWCTFAEPSDCCRGTWLNIQWWQMSHQHGYHSFLWWGI